jgi:hypothetical protein
MLQTAFSPSHRSEQPPPQESMSQWLPAPHPWMLHPPLLQSPTRHAPPALLQSKLQPPEQPGIVQLPPWQGREHPPVSLQSRLHVAPVSQLA